MVEFRKILCPTDFSKYSFRAADYAVAVAKHYDGEVHFLHVIPSTLLHPDQYPYVTQSVDPGPEMRRKAQDRLDAFVALSRAENVRTRSSVEEGMPVPTILDVAEREESDLICIGTHGREGFERLVLGSVAEKVLRKALCPVLTVSEAGKEEAIEPALFETIVCAVDFATLSLRAVEFALSLAKEAGGKLILMNVLEWFSEEPGWEAKFSVEEYREQMEAKVLERLNELVPEGFREVCEVETVVRSGKPYREILELATERDADVIIMGVRGRNPLDRMLFGSTTEHVVRHATCPVLTIRGKRS